MATPTADDKDEVLLSCRYGDLEDIQEFVKRFGQDALARVRDENGSTVLHMAAGNGHEDVLDYLLSVVPPLLLSTQNNPGSTPLHWAALNSYLTIAQKLVQFPGGPGVALIDIKNFAGRSPLAEAETTGWEEGAKWLVEMMRLDPEESDTVGGDVEGSVGEDLEGKDVEVEIEDADGQVAKMTIGGGAPGSSRSFN